jgi:hypothetical protein
VGEKVNRSVLRRYCPHFGQIVVDMGFVTEEQVREALSEQAEDDFSNRRHRLIGEIFFEKGWITIEQMTIILDTVCKYERQKTGHSAK